MATATTRDSDERGAEPGLAQVILRRFARLRGVDLVVPEREPVREPPVPEQSS